jgi:hypothetical protein
MSNFLQRVAAGVIQPQARLRPMLGSIFAPAALRSSEAALPAEAEIASQTSSSHRQEHIPPPTFNASIAASRDRLLPTIVQADFSSVSPHRSLNNDQLPLTTFATPSELRKPTQAHPFTEDSDRTSESLKPAAAHQPQMAGGQQPAPKPQPYEPLITTMQQTSSRLQPREPMPTATTIRSSRAEAARRSQPAQREPDEVHIHIGRIEVAAITQQAPRPAAAAARRSLNLGDYLKHGNGRPG